MSLRIERVNELIHHSLATLILRHVNAPDFNPALVTISHVITSPDLRSSRVLVSINAPPEQQFKMLGILKHKAPIHHTGNAVVNRRFLQRILPRG